MGAGESKETGAPSQHVFAADQPNPPTKSFAFLQTDSTRVRNQELQMQTRVTTELERLASESAKYLSDLTAAATSSQSSQEPSSSSDSSLLDKAKSAITGTNPNSSEPSHDSVQKEISELRKKLEERKKIEKVDSATEKAREELVACLRTNDRRPLDCWKEVEDFKREVGRLERRFVEGAVR
ncbi:MAG: hypothetical protein Q9165_006947 [Trypethelium subeluteriae]